MVRTMNIQVEAGTRVNALTTVLQVSGASPLIMVFVGPRAVSLELEKAADIARRLSAAAAEKGKVAISLYDTVWEIPPETATRIASAISGELSKVGVGG